MRLSDSDCDRRREEQQFRLLVEAAPNAIVIIDAAGTITFVNAQAEKTFGYTRPELIGQTIELLVPERLKAGHATQRREFAEERKARALETGRQFLGRRKDGSELPLEISLSPMDAREGVAILATIVDVTERQEAKDSPQRLNALLQQRVAERTAELEASNKELEAFSYSVSHDLRAPLRAIDGFSELLVRKFGAGLDPEAMGYLKRIRTNATQMGRLIDDLLALSRLGRHALGRQAIDNAALVDECLKSLSVVYAGRKVPTVIGDLPHCHGDPVLLKQVWMNLLDNAMKFTSKTCDARIEIGGHVEGGECVYDVRDNGAGFDTRFADKLFNAFQRLHSAADFPGTGIGLAIVERIVRRHGGRVWAESVPGSSATFHFAITGASADV